MNLSYINKKYFVYIKKNKKRIKKKKQKTYKLFNKYIVMLESLLNSIKDKEIKSDYWKTFDIIKNEIKIVNNNVNTKEIDTLTYKIITRISLFSNNELNHLLTKAYYNDNISQLLFIYQLLKRYQITKQNKLEINEIKKNKLFFKFMAEVNYNYSLKDLIKQFKMVDKSNNDELYNLLIRFKIFALY